MKTDSKMMIFAFALLVFTLQPTVRADFLGSAKIKLQSTETNIQDLTSAIWNQNLELIQAIAESANVGKMATFLLDPAQSEYKKSVKEALENFKHNFNLYANKKNKKEKLLWWNMQKQLQVLSEKGGNFLSKISFGWDDNE